MTDEQLFIVVGIPTVFIILGIVSQQLGHASIENRLTMMESNLRSEMQSLRAEIQSMRLHIMKSTTKLP